MTGSAIVVSRLTPGQRDDYLAFFDHERGPAFADNPEWARQVCEQITVVSPDVILESVEAGSVKVISSAAVNPTPVSPNVGRNTMLGGVLGLVISVGIILLTVLLDNKIHTEDDIAKYLDLAVVGVIPEYHGGKKK